MFFRSKSMNTLKKSSLTQFDIDDFSNSVFEKRIILSSIAAFYNVIEF